MPRAAKLGRLKGYWYTRAGCPSGVYFGKVGEVSHADARKRFRKYLASLDEGKLQQVLPALSVAEVCDAHLKWVRVERSEALFKQRRSFLNHWCRHKVDELRSQRLPGHGKMVGYLRATVVSRGHVEEYLTSRRTQPSERTGRPLSDKGIRAVIVALKACWNWAADSVEDGGGGFFEDSHRPFAKLSRGYVAPKDLSEADLPTPEEIECLFRWAAIEPTLVRGADGTGPGRRGGWRDRTAEERDTHDSRVFADMLRLYYATGCRTSELCQTLVRDFMPRTKQICLGKHKRVRTQHNPSVRNIQVGESTLDILCRNARGKQSDQPLFSREQGDPWNQDLVNKRLKAVRKLAVSQGDVIRDHITPYSFRDLYISELMMLGTPPFQVAKMAGTSLREIERTYGHFFNHDLASAQARLEEARRNVASAS